MKVVSPANDPTRDTQRLRPAVEQEDEVCVLMQEERPSPMTFTEREGNCAKHDLLNRPFEREVVSEHNPSYGTDAICSEEEERSD